MWRALPSPALAAWSAVALPCFQNDSSEAASQDPLAREPCSLHAHPPKYRRAINEHWPLPAVIAERDSSLAEDLEDDENSVAERKRGQGHVLATGGKEEGGEEEAAQLQHRTAHRSDDSPLPTC